MTRKLILGIKWDRLKEAAMKSDSKSDSITVSILDINKPSTQLILRDAEKALLRRYIQNETHKPNFLNCEDYV